MEEAWKVSLLNMFANTFETAANHMKNFKEGFPTIRIQQASNVCNILETLLRTFTPGENNDDSI